MEDVDAKILMEEGWKARENLEFDKAEKLLTQAKEAFEQSKDWFNVTEALNHLAYTQKLKAYQISLKGMEYAKEAEQVSLDHATKKVFVLRTLMSLASSLGLFEQALSWGKDCLDLMDKPANKADILSHTATFQLRTGHLKEAEDAIKQAETLMDEGFSYEKEPHRSIWKCKILITKSLVFYNKGDVSEAREYINQAQKIAKEKDLKTRLEETRSVLELL